MLWRILRSCYFSEKTNITLTLKVKETLPKDVGRAIARIDPEDMKLIGLEVGDIIEIEGKRKNTC